MNCYQQDGAGWHINADDVFSNRREALSASILSKQLKITHLNLGSGGPAELREDDVSVLAPKPEPEPSPFPLHGYSVPIMQPMPAQTMCVDFTVKTAAAELGVEADRAEPVVLDVAPWGEPVSRRVG